MTEKEIEELEKLYRQKSYCPHKRSEVTLDDRIYFFKCPDCGMRAMADFNAALKLGWLIPHDPDRLPRG